MGLRNVRQRFVQVRERQQEKKRGMKRRRRKENVGVWNISKRGKKNKQPLGRHSHDRWALPVRWYVAVPRCPLGPVGWHSDWVCSHLGVLGRCQQGPCRKSTTPLMELINF